VIVDPLITDPFVIEEFLTSLRGALATKQSGSLLDQDWIASLRSQ
jgi:hypothetical protein